MATRQKMVAAKQMINEDFKAPSYMEGWSQLVNQGSPEDRGLDHLKVISYVRKYCFEFGSLPPIRLVVRRTGISLRCLRELFPQGYTKDVYKSDSIDRNAIGITSMHHVQS